MDFFEAVEKRRSIRKFKKEAFPEEFIKKALEAATLAPNSSNMQTWDFYWIKDPAKKQKIVEYCLNQSGARTAQELIVVSADPKKWKRSNPQMIKFVDQVNAPTLVKDYYKKLIPLTYSWGLFNSLGILKKILYQVIGLFRPITRGPSTKNDLQIVAIKSAALACENFILAITAQGGATLAMEGFDHQRVHRLLRLPSSAKIVMIIGVGYEDERGTWGPRMRIAQEQVVHIV